MKPSAQASPRSLHHGQVEALRPPPLVCLSNRLLNSQAARSLTLPHELPFRKGLQPKTVLAQAYKGTNLSGPISLKLFPMDSYGFHPHGGAHHGLGQLLEPLRALE